MKEEVDRKSAIYKELKLPLLILGLLSVPDTVRTGHKGMMLIHLKELMADAELYSWEPIQSYHTVWLQYLENGRAAWSGYKLKMEFRRSLVWHSGASRTKIKLQPRNSQGKNSAHCTPVS